jgi:hypothetical protein
VSSEAAINGVIDAVLARIAANYTPLGITSVEERDEEPRYIEPSTAFVIPFAEGKDSIKMLQGGEEHTFPITIVGFYKYPTIAAGLRPVRTYGLVALDLFTRENSTIISSDGLHGAEATDATFEVFYWRNGDFVMHAWSLQLSIRQVADC